jgi:type II secretory ATPase GspE/PulE/Tfp pilus assembly ATPase PilB-like protein
MGVEPFLVSSSVEGIMAQRLVRRICPECAVPHTPEAADLPSGFELSRGETLMRGVGCRTCRNTGYRGRVGVYELLEMSDALRELIMQRKNAHEIASRARADGHLATLREDGFAKARAGVTTIAEVLRALSA